MEILEILETRTSFVVPRGHGERLALPSQGGHCSRGEARTAQPASTATGAFLSEERGWS